MLIDLMLDHQVARLEHLARVMARTREAWLRESAALALLREGLPGPGMEGDRALERARAEADKSSVAPAVIREHPIEGMFRRGQLKPEWRWLFEMFHDLSEVAEGRSAGVVDLERPMVQSPGSVPQFRTAQLEAIHLIEERFKAPIRRRAGPKAEAVFDITHRFGRHINSVMSVSQLGADGRFGKRKTVGQLLARAYEALAAHHGITAARARARFRREPGAVPVADPGSWSGAGVVNPLTPEEAAEIEAHRAAELEAQRAAEAARFQREKERAAELQRQRRQGERPAVREGGGRAG